MTEDRNPPDDETPAELPGEEAEDSERFIYLQPRETEEASRISRYSRRVSWLRYALPSAALLVVATLFLWPKIHGGDLKTMVGNNIPDVVIENLHFTGMDSKNQPYSLKAAKATRPGGLQNIYDLERPEGETTLADGAWVAGRADYGRYDQDARKLWLGGNVQLFHDTGYQFTSDEAQVNLNTSEAWGDRPVVIQGDFGTVEGQAFRLLQSGKVAVVKGPARAVLDLQGLRGSDKPAGMKE